MNEFYLRLSLEINFRFFFVLFIRPPEAFVLIAAIWYLRAKFSTKTTPTFYNFVDLLISDWSSFKFEGNLMFILWSEFSTCIVLALPIFNFNFLLNIHVCTTNISSLSNVWKFNYQMRGKKVILNVIYRPTHGNVSLFLQKIESLTLESEKKTKLM